MALKLRILFLDDQQYRINAFKQLLAQTPVSITWANTAKEAIAALRARRYDIVSLDHDLGGKGFEADTPADVQQIQQVHPGAPITMSGPQEQDGLTVAQALVKTVNRDSKIFIHSMNPVGAMHMKQVMPNAQHIPWIHIHLETQMIQGMARQANGGL